ncbi:MAG: IS66 family transposase [Pseudomonadota bacterium]
MELSDDIARLSTDPTLPKWIAEVADRLVKEAQKTARLNAELHTAKVKIEALTLELAHHRRMRFGAKAEALSAEQRDLFQETWEADLAELEARVEVEVEVDAPKKKRARAGRQPLPDHLERIVHLHEPDSCTCGQCGGELVKIGEDITEQLDVEPARFFVHRHIRPQYACRPCETVTAAHIPPAIIDGGLAAPGLLAWIAISKYVDHLPLYRIEQIAARSDVILPRSNQSEWIGRIGFALQPLVDRLIHFQLQRDTLHADETPVAQLDPGKGKTKKAYLWAYRTGDLEDGPPIVVFDYQPGRSGQCARDYLQQWQGHLMVDDFSGYKALFRAGVTELACWAHARRKLFDLHAANKSPVAEQALKWIARLYAVEIAGKELDVSARAVLRARESKPLLDDFETWLKAVRPTVAPGSGTAKALDYTIRRWTALIRYADSGSFPIDNNPVENSIRPIAIGKKNWLYAGSERAGRRAAAIQSLLGTAKLNGLDPAAWLRNTLEKLPTCRNSDIDDLLPFRRVKPT